MCKLPLTRTIALGAVITGVTRENIVQAFTAFLVYSQMPHSSTQCSASLSFKESRPADHKLKRVELM